MPAPAPALFRLEQDVLRWLCTIFGYGPDARAVLTPGSSLAMLSAVVTARHAHFGESGRSVPGHRLHVAAGPPQRGQGRPSGRHPHRPTASGGGGRRLPPAPRRAGPGRRPGSRPRPATVPGGRRRRHHQHRRHRSPARAGRPVRRRIAVAARRRRVRRRFRAHPARPRPAGGHRTRRQHRLRSAQGHVPALRHRLPAGPRRRGPAASAPPGRRVPAGSRRPLPARCRSLRPSWAPS